MILILYLFVILLGLVIGSFLNVLIYRYPIMLKREWEQEAHDILDQNYHATVNTFNLFKPDSHCPACKTPIKAYQNIPLISYLFLKGRCAHCREKISSRYPIVEVISALLAFVAANQFGFSTTGFAAMIFSWGLLAISFIDFDEHFIPDTLTYLLLWVGLFCNTYHMFTSPQYAVLGAIAGYLLFWCIAKLFKLIRGKEGLGYGDFKLLAMIGAWLGVTALLNVIIIASITGLLYGILLLCLRRLKSGEQIPFGPFLAFAGWCTLIFGSFITAAIIYA